MNKLLFTMIVSLLIVSDLSAGYYSDGTNVDDWQVYTEEGGDITTENSAIHLSGNGRSTGYRLDLTPLDNTYGVDTIQWKMRYSEDFTLYIQINTQKGVRYMIYSPRDEDRGLSGQSIRFGLGSDANDGTWKTFRRNLSKDLFKYDPHNSLRSITRFLIRGSGELDSIETFRVLDGMVVLEDSEDGTTDGWRVYTGDADNAEISNLLIYAENGRNHRVIKLEGEGKSTGYILGGTNDNNGWNLKRVKMLEWSMKYSEDFTIYLALTTQKGRRYLVYTPRNTDRGLYGNYIGIGIGSFAMQGEWQGRHQMLSEDLKKYEPDNELISLNGFLVRGSGMLDSIRVFQESSYEILEKLMALRKIQDDEIYEIGSSSRLKTVSNRLPIMGLARYLTEDPANLGEEPPYRFTEYYALSEDKEHLVRLFQISPIYTGLEENLIYTELADRLSIGYAIAYNQNTGLYTYRVDTYDVSNPREAHRISRRDEFINRARLELYGDAP